MPEDFNRASRESKLPDSRLQTAGMPTDSATLYYKTLNDYDIICMWDVMIRIIYLNRYDYEVIL